MDHLKNAKRIAKLLDSQFSFLGHKFGIEPIIGLIPWAGDTITLFLSLYIVYAGYSMKLPKRVIAQLIANVAIDYFVGLVPIVGDAIDFFYKANERNFALLKKYETVQEGEIIEE